MKKIIVIGFIIALLIAVITIISDTHSKEIKKLKIKNFDPSEIKDGVYIGEYEVFPVSAKVETTVFEGKITKIQIIEHVTGKGYSAEKIVDDVISKQSLELDVISGATSSSKVILKAIESSLK